MEDTKDLWDLLRCGNLNQITPLVEADIETINKADQVWIIITIIYSTTHKNKY